MLKKGWAYNMNPYLKEFLHRGLIFSGLGPIIAGIVYLILELSQVKLDLNGIQIFVAILTTYIIAFVHAGTSVFHQIEKWGPAKSLLCQLLSLYIVYIVGYLINRWIPLDFIVILIFTGAFIGGYLIIWFSIYFTMKKSSSKLKEKLNEQKSLKTDM